MEEDAVKEIVQTNGTDTQAPASPAVSLSVEEKAKRLGIPFLVEAPKDIDKAALALISEETARKYRMAVFSRDGSVVKIAMADPEDFESLNILRFLSEKEQLSIEISLATDEVLQAIFGMYTTADSALSEAILSLKKDDASTGVELLSDKEIQARESENDGQVMQDALPVRGQHTAQRLRVALGLDQVGQLQAGQGVFQRCDRGHVRLLRRNHGGIGIPLQCRFLCLAGLLHPIRQPFGSGLPAVLRRH